MEFEYNYFIKMKYPRCFYLNDTFHIAGNLLGSTLCTIISDQFTSGRIAEVEVYLGTEDKASHAYGGRKTKRNEAQYRSGGIAYIFFVYGMHSQFCVVTGPENVPHAILIRALEPLRGIDIMKKRRKTETILNLTSGPGKLCQAMGITTAFNGIDLTGNTIWIEPGPEPIPESSIVQAKRIGIDYAEEYREKPWRFYIRDNPHISRKQGGDGA